MADKTRSAPFSAEQEKWYAQACERLNRERLKKLLLNLIDVHSPTGAERQASEFMTGYMREHLGERSLYQPITEDTGNAVAEVRGSGGGAALLLYAPIDTHLEADPDRDLPWAGPTLRADMLPKSFAQGDLVYGLGAANPKGMVASLTEVAIAMC